MLCFGNCKLRLYEWVMGVEVGVVEFVYGFDYGGVIERFLL